MQVLSEAITPSLYLSVGDTVRVFEAILTDAADEPVNLTGATVTLRRVLNTTGSTVEEFVCEIFNQTENPGKVRVTWPDDSNNVPGDYKASFRAVWAGRQDTYPKGYYDYFVIRIHEGL